MIDTARLVRFGEVVPWRQETAARERTPAA
jgi:hypothetical protein